MVEYARNNFAAGCTNGRITLKATRSDGSCCPMAYCPITGKNIRCDHQFYPSKTLDFLYCLKEFSELGFFLWV